MVRAGGGIETAVADLVAGLTDAESDRLIERARAASAAPFA
jgi:hypothetical protein